MKPKSKKLPKWVIPVGIAAAILIVLVMRKKANQAGANATEPGAQGLTNQSFIPVTGENVPGVGAAGYGGNSNVEGLLSRSLEQQQEQNKAFTEYLKESALQTQTNDREQMEAQQRFATELISTLGTGGGAPMTGAPSGTTVAPPPEEHWISPPAPPAPPAAPSPPASSCPPEFPMSGPHGCYRWSRTKSSDGCPCHGYQSGLLVCQHKHGGTCTW